MEVVVRINVFLDEAMSKKINRYLRALSAKARVTGIKEDKRTKEVFIGQLVAKSFIDGGYEAKAIQIENDLDVLANKKY
jgi:hypothetical protein